MPIVKAVNLSKVYNDEFMLDNINFEVQEGAFFVVLGKVNSGKTPLLEIMAGLKFPDQGEITVLDMDSHNNKMIKNNVSFVPDTILYYEKITAYQLFQKTMNLHNVNKLDECEMLCELFGIDMDEYLMDMTYNDNKCIALINAIMLEPKLLILDEPYNYLTAENYQKLLKLLDKTCKKGMTVILACEEYKELRGYCDYYIYLSEGDLIKQGELSKNERFWKMVTIEGYTFCDCKLIRGIPIGQYGDREFFLYNGDVKKLIEFLEESRCINFLVEELTFEERIFLDFKRWIS